MIIRNPQSGVGQTSPNYVANIVLLVLLAFMSAVFIGYIIPSFADKNSDKIECSK